MTVNSVKRYLFLSHNLLDSNGLHGGEGLPPFQKALRDRRNFFSVANIITIQDRARKKGTVAYVCYSTLQDRQLVASASLLLNCIATPGPASTEISVSRKQNNEGHWVSVVFNYSAYSV